MIRIDNAIDIALKNIAKHGDTDIFPFPLEKMVFHDLHDKCNILLLDLHNKFNEYYSRFPPETLESLTQVGYTGFRWATQIQPFWNAYYLALTVQLAQEIESQRIPVEDRTVFSYRYCWNDDDAKLFADSSWSDYRSRSLELSREYKFVLITDIADFYPRIYHHRLENALSRLPNSGDTHRRIMTLLGSFSKNVSYGLPVGGPASRILSELCIDSTDKMLVRNKVKYCRYADDYSIFCNDKAEAYRLLVKLSESLFTEGLVLQKNKTKIMTTDEFSAATKLLDPADIKDPTATDEQKLLNVSLRYDPYSETADDDYDSLKLALKDIDIIGILGREVAKTTIDSSVTKQAIKAVKLLSQEQQFGAIKTLLGEGNLNVLSPVFVSVMRCLRAVYDNMSEFQKNFIDRELTALHESSFYLLSVDLNLSFFIQVLSQRQTPRKEEILIELYDKKTSPLIKRQIIITMSMWKCHYWLTNIKTKYAGLSSWEKCYFIGASYSLGDEGKYWREHVKSTWSPMDLVVRDWFADRVNHNRVIPI